MRFQSYEEAERWALSRKSMLVYYEPFAAALHEAGDPQNGLLCFHVAGTNGKGSTCRFLYHILKTKYAKVGLYTSPQLESIRDRIRINDKWIPEDVFLSYANRYAEIIEKYTALTGRPALPPEWSFGLWLTTSFTTNYDEDTVTGFIEGFRQRQIPLQVFHFDCFWMKGFEWCNFLWDKDMFPDPEGMLRRYHERGLKICVWINPYIAQKSPLFREGMEAGYLLKKNSRKVWQWDLWQAGMALVDFTNPDACAWYQSKLKALLDMGVDCFKTDFGERVPTDVVWYDGSDPMKMHNYYTHLYNKCVFDLLVRERGEGEACLFARSATAGGQQFPVHWGGDSTSQYISMAETLRGGLSLMDSGFGFWSHDIGGFEDQGSADLYKRWVAFGLLSSHSRLHGSSSYRVPWNYDDEASDVLRFFVNLKQKLMPYILELAKCAHEKGIPVLRPMHMEFPDDPACAYLDQQYMLGSRILVSPVFSEDGRQRFYLPEGNWAIFRKETGCTSSAVSRRRADAGWKDAMTISACRFMCAKAILFLRWCEIQDPSGG